MNELKEIVHIETPELLTFSVALPLEGVIWLPQPPVFLHHVSLNKHNYIIQLNTCSVCITLSKYYTYLKNSVDPDQLVFYKSADLESHMFSFFHKHDEFILILKCH